MPVQGFASDWLASKVDKMAFPRRSGDIYIVPLPYQPLKDKMNNIEHSGPWRYDSYVPLIFASAEFKKERISTAASPIDIAATLAAILQIKQPSASVGSPLAAVTHYYE